ncbi:MAG: single-stranded DNA-binding protein [Bacillota bacterium]|nr:single-stranded DNA-binding protein [Bacillota bacterium]
MLNKVMLMGRLTADPVVRYTASNLPVASFSLAVGRNYVKKDSSQRETDFIDIVCWRSTAEFVGKYFVKGAQVVVCGSLQTRTWQDKEGKNRKTVEVVADEVYFADSKRDNSRQDTREAAPANNPAPAYQSDETDEFFELSNDGDLPF